LGQVFKFPAPRKKFPAHVKKIPCFALHKITMYAIVMTGIYSKKSWQTDQKSSPPPNIEDEATPGAVQRQNSNATIPIVVASAGL
jgi:hypothetical protein